MHRPGSRLACSLARNLSTSVRRPAPHRLTQPSSYIRRIGAPLDFTSEQRGTLERDFALYTDWYDVEECRTLLKMALKKLDGMDGQLRRNRRRKSQTEMQTEENEELAGPRSLQALFSEAYGFEDVRRARNLRIGQVY